MRCLLPSSNIIGTPEVQTLLPVSPTPTQAFHSSRFQRVIVRPKFDSDHSDEHARGQVRAEAEAFLALVSP